MGSKKKANKEEIAKTKQDEQGMSIEYLSLPGNKVIIMGFSGIMSEFQLTNKFGPSIISAYGHCPFYAFLLEGNAQTVFIRHSIGDKETTDSYVVGETIDKAELAKIRGLLKKCGENLHAVVMAFRFGSIKTLRA